VLAEIKKFKVLGQEYSFRQVHISLTPPNQSITNSYISTRPSPQIFDAVNQIALKRDKVNEKMTAEARFKIMDSNSFFFHFITFLANT